VLLPTYHNIASNKSIFFSLPSMKNQDLAINEDNIKIEKTVPIF